MPSIKITKQQLEDAKKARQKALKDDPVFKAYEDEMERTSKEAINQPEEEA